MKRKNSYNKMYAKSLTNAIVKQSEGVIPQNEAQIASIGIAQTLARNGQTPALNSVNQMAKTIIQQKTRYENGELIYVPGEGVTDTKTGQFMKEEE